MFNFQNWFITILIFFNGCPCFTILKERNKFLLCWRWKQGRKKKAKCPHFQPHTNFLPLFTSWSIHGDKKPKTLSWTISLCAGYIPFLTWEVSYLLGFFLIFRVMQPDLYPVLLHCSRPLQPWRKLSSLWLHMQHGWSLEPVVHFKASSLCYSCP